MGKLEPLFVPSSSVDVTTLLSRLTAARAGYLDNINNVNLATIADISSLTATEIAYLANINNANLATIPNISTLTATEIARLDADISSRAPANEYDTQLDANMSTRAPASEYDTEMARITANVATEAKQDTIDGIVDDIKAKTDNLSGANADVSGNLTWVTATHTTNEGDISALFSTDLTGATRRKYAVYVDLTGAEADAAAWTKCTVRVKVGFGVGDAYRTVDKKEIAKTDVAAASEPGVPIDVPATAKNVQITLQFDVALNADATIYYTYVKEVLE